MLSLLLGQNQYHSDDPSYLLADYGPRIIAMMMNSQTSLAMTTTIRNLLSTDVNPPIDEVIAIGAIPALMHCMSQQTVDELQLEAAWSLTNIASGNAAQTQLVVDAGALPEFVALVAFPDPELAEQGVWGLGNIAGDSVLHHDDALRAHALDALVAAFNPDLFSNKLSMLRNIVWAISNMARGNAERRPAPAFGDVAAALPLLARTLHHTDHEVLTDTCWALSYIAYDSADDKQRIQGVQEAVD